MKTEKLEEIIKLLSGLKSEFFTDQNGDWATSLVINGKRTTCHLNSEEIRNIVFLLARKNLGLTLTTSDLDTILSQMKGLVFDSGKVQKVYRRAGKLGDVHYIDCGDVYCIIDKDGARLSEDVPCLFYRSKRFIKTASPMLGKMNEGLSKLESRFNLEYKTDYYLILAFIVKSLMAESGACPFLAIQGIQGSGKSTVSENIKYIIDPCSPLLRSLPSSIEDLAPTALNNYMLAFDNLSYIKPDIADFICQLSTGGGIAKRKLYSNSDEVSYSLNNPLLLNGIDDLITRADLMDRGIIIVAAKISREKRKSESEIKGVFFDQYPIMMGAVLELLARVIQILPTIRTTDLARMTEYNRVGIAIEKALSLEDGFFTKIYQENISRKFDSIAQSDPICSLILKLLEPPDELEDFEGQIEGTATQLITLFKKNSRGFDLDIKGPRALRNKLDRLTAVLESHGIEVTYPARTANQRLIRIAKIHPSLEPDYTAL